MRDWPTNTQKCLRCPGAYGQRAERVAKVSRGMTGSGSKSLWDYFPPPPATRFKHFSFAEHPFSLGRVFHATRYSTSPLDQNVLQVKAELVLIAAHHFRVKEKDIIPPPWSRPGLPCTEVSEMRLSARGLKEDIKVAAIADLAESSEVGWRLVKMSLGLHPETAGEEHVRHQLISVLRAHFGMTPTALDFRSGRIFGTVSVANLVMRAASQRKSGKAATTLTESGFEW